MIKGLTIIFGSILFVVLIIISVMALFKMPSENRRKTFHFAFLFTVTMWLYAFDDWRYSVISMLAFLVLAFPVLCVFDRIPFIARHLPERKKGEFKQSLIAAAFMYIIVVLIGWGLMKQRCLCLAAFYAWGPGDAAAALIGKRYGRTKIGKQKKKTLEGSASMFIIAFISVYAILSYNAAFPSDKIAIVSFFTALVAAIVELYTLSGYDTLFCPVSAVITLSLFRHLMR